MELERINLIKNSSKTDLENVHYLENLIISLGFNTEILREQPEVVRKNGGGLLIWQYPNQFSKYLLLLKTLKIHSYIEIGCRWGGTFILTNEYLKMFNSMDKSVAVDIIDSPVVEYCLKNTNTTFLKMNSQSREFQNYIKDNFFDLIFIDGDHSYLGVKNDYEVCKNSGNVFVFHDIVNDVCPGVVYFWKELKETEKDGFIFFEFIEQYPEVVSRTGQNFLGIGVMIRKVIQN